MAQRPPGHCIQSHPIHQSRPQSWLPPPSGRLCAAPAKGCATAGYHSHIVATATNLDSVLLGSDAWPWGFSRTSTLEQRESDPQVTSGLAIVCCRSPSCPEGEGAPEAGESTGLQPPSQAWLLPLSSDVHWALHCSLPLDMFFPLEVSLSVPDLPGPWPGHPPT